MFTDNHIREYRAKAKKAMASVPAYTPELFSGSGIVIEGGGLKYFPGAWVLINMLRRFGCTLPIELWYLGEFEISDEIISMLEPLDVKCIDGLEVVKKHNLFSEDHHSIAGPKEAGGWQMKAVAIAYSSFKNVLFLDADNIPTRDPSFIFNTPQYKDTGSIFWPDYNFLPRSRKIWEICEVPYKREKEFETGQIAVNKEQCWKELQLTIHINEESNFYYKFVYGDTDTFHMAWMMYGTPYSLVPYGIRTIPYTMCQHDFKGRRLFQHRNRDKWTIYKRQSKIKEFRYEDLCIEYLETLKSTWSQRLGPDHDTDSIQRATAQIVQLKNFILRYANKKQKIILSPGGVVRNSKYRRWQLYDGADGLRMVLFHADGSRLDIDYPGHQLAPTPRAASLAITKKVVDNDIYRNYRKNTTDSTEIKTGVHTSAIKSGRGALRINERKKYRT